MKTLLAIAAGLIGAALLGWALIIIGAQSCSGGAP